MDTLMQDLRYALRTLARTPGFTVAAVLTLVLGVGANTAIFSIVDGVLLRPAPFADVERIAVVWQTDRASGTTREPASIPDYGDFRSRAATFGQLAAFAPVEVTVAPDGVDPLRVAALAASREFLPLLGISPVAGRGFTAEEDQAGGPRAVLVSEAFAQRTFGGSAAALGAQLRLNDVAWTVTGVVGAGADFGMIQVLGAAAYQRGFADRGGRPVIELWLPLRPNPAASRDNHPIFVLGRLADGVSIQAAQQEMDAISADLEETFASNADRGVHVEPLPAVIFRDARPALVALLVAVALVLLVACANVANLLLARGTTRLHDVTVRLALGASAGRLARQYLAEGLVLAVAGALGGLLLARWMLDVLLALAPATFPRVADVGIDARVLAATIVVTAIVALVFGLLPTLQALRHGAASPAGDTRTATARREHRGFRSVVVAAELALAVMLMAGAGLMIRSLWSLQAVDPGFRAEGVLKAEYQLPATRYPQDYAVFPRWVEAQRFTDEVRSRLAALPGVRAATVAGNHPLEAGFTSSIVVPGREAEAGSWPEPSIRRIDAGYLATLGVRLVAGRNFSVSDDAVAAPVVLINEAARRTFFAGGEAVGGVVRLWGAERAVVGIVGDERMHGLDEATPPAIYLPLTQAPVTSGSLLLRVAGDPAALAPAVQRVVRDLDPGLALFGVEPLAVTITGQAAERRFTMLVLGVFAVLALVLAALGVHGVLAFTLAQRWKEIGIRMALGADRGRVRGLVVGQGARLAAWGLGAGLVGAVAGTRVLGAMLFGVRPWDPATLASVVLLLGVVALLACWIPAWRATRVEPMAALRAE